MKNVKLIATVVLYLFTISVVFIFITLNINNNQGFFCYPLDDTYIHMAIAKTFSKYHIWGVTKYEFVSATSSPLYTFLLSTHS